MKVVNGKELCKLLEAKGWELKRIHGSHHIFSKPGKVEQIVVPVHGTKNIKPGLLRKIMKIADIDESEL